MKSRAWLGNLLLFLLTLIYCYNFLSRQLPAVLGTFIRTDLQLSFTELGLLYGVWFSLFYSVSGVFMGHLADRYSRKWLIVASLFFWSLATFLSGFAPSLFILVVLRILVGLSQSASSPASYSLIAQLFPDRIGMASSVYASGIFFGIGFSFLIGGSIGLWFGWRMAFWLLGLCGIVLSVLAAIVIREPKNESEIKAGAVPIGFANGFMDLVSKPLFRWHLAGSALLALSGYAILSFISSFLREVHQAPSLIPHFGWFMLGTGLSVNLAGWISDYLSRNGAYRRYLAPMAAALLGIPLYAMGFLSKDASMSLAFIGLGAVITSSYNGVAASLVQLIAPVQSRGLAVGVYLFVISVVGLGAGPFISGWLMDLYFVGEKGMAQSLMLVTSLAGVSSFLCLWRAMNLMK